MISLWNTMAPMTTHLFHNRNLNKAEIIPPKLVTKTKNVLPVFPHKYRTNPNACVQQQDHYFTQPVQLIPYQSLAIRRKKPIHPLDYPFVFRHVSDYYSCASNPDRSPLNSFCSVLKQKYIGSKLQQGNIL